MEMVREDSGLPWSAIGKVLLVGGSIRMRAVPAIAEKVSGKKPSFELHADEVVAMGAALQAELISRESGSHPLVQRDDFPLVVINDVCSHSLGVVAVDESGRPKNSIIVPRNTSIPCKQSDTYATVADRQTEIMLQVTEGEDQELEYVTIALEAPLKIPPYPSGAPVEVTFQYDANGVIRITVLDLTAKKSLGEVQLVRKGNLTDEQVKAKQVDLRKVAVN
jgi:molecular chaperone DnaK